MSSRELELQTMEGLERKAKEVLAYSGRVYGTAQKLTNLAATRMQQDFCLEPSDTMSRSIVGMEVLRKFYGDTPATIDGYEAGFRLAHAKLAKWRKPSQLMEEAKFALKCMTLNKRPLEDVFAFPIAAILGAANAGSNKPVEEMMLPFSEYAGLKLEHFMVVLGNKSHIFRAADKMLNLASGRGAVLSGREENLNIVAAVHNFAITTSRRK